MPAAMATDIMGLLRDVSPMEQICDVQTIDGTSWEQVKVTAGGSAGRVAERGTRSETNTPTFGKLKIDCHGYYAYPTVTQEQLFMANGVDLGAFVMNDGNLEIQELVEADYLTGTGVGCPFGLLANATLTGAAKVSGASATLLNFDAFRNMTGAIHDSFLGGARWMMKRATEVALAILKDGAGNYMLQGVAAGMPTSLMGYPISYNGFMPAIGAGTYPVAFGNFQQGYSIRISRFMLLIRDEITSPGYVKMYKEIKKGGDVKRTDAISLLKIAAS
jgi:HK97 family phage major capsid protein